VAVEAAAMMSTDFPSYQPDDDPAGFEQS